MSSDTSTGCLWISLLVIFGVPVFILTDGKYTGMGDFVGNCFGLYAFTAIIVIVASAFIGPRI